MRYLWKYVERWNAVLEKKRLMNSWENVGDCCLIVHWSSILVQCLQKGSVGVEQILAKEAEQAQRLRRQQAQILGEQASTRLLFPMILNVARGVCDFAGAGMADIRSLTVENRNMSYL